MADFEDDAQHKHSAKAGVYRMLSACYYEPEEAFLEEDIFGQLEHALSALGSQLNTEVTVLGNSFRATSYGDLRIDYTRLFLGPFDIRSKPYGSIYLDGGNIVMGDSTMSLLGLYRDGGFQVDDEFTELPDHVAVELEFLYLLNARLGDSQLELSAQDRLDQLQHSMLNHHLGQWVVPFTEAMKKGANTAFYRKLADLTQSFVLDDLRTAALLR